MREFSSLNIGAPRQKPDPMLMGISASNLPYRILSEGLTWYRKWAKENEYTIEYSSDGGGSWETILTLEPDEETIIISIDEGLSGFRDLVRSGAYVIDELIEGDWIQIINIKG